MPRTSGSNVCQARGKSAWYVPPPTGRSQPHAGRSAGRSADSTVARDAVRPARRRPRTRRRRPARDGAADLEVPAGGVATVRAPDAPRAEPADRDAGEFAVVDHRDVDARVADVRRTGRRCRAARRRSGSSASRAPRSRRAPARSLLDAGDDHAAHERPLRQQEDDDRHDHRHQGRGLDERRLRRVQRVVLLDPDRQRLELRLAGEVQQRDEEVVPGEEEVEQATRR